MYRTAHQLDIKSRKKLLHKLAQQCADILRDKHTVNRVILIGSLVKGRVHENSDIDIVVEGLPSKEYINTLTELWDMLPAGVPLNLIPLEDAFTSMKEKALKEGKVLYER